MMKQRLVSLKLHRRHHDVWRHWPLAVWLWHKKNNYAKDGMISLPCSTPNFIKPWAGRAPNDCQQKKNVFILFFVVVFQDQPWRGQLRRSVRICGRGSHPTPVRFTETDCRSSLLQLLLNSHPPQKSVHLMVNKSHNNTVNTLLFFMVYFAFSHWQWFEWNKIDKTRQSAVNTNRNGTKADQQHYTKRWGIL